MTRITYSKEFKDQVLKRADEIGVKSAAEEFNITPQAVYNWSIAANNSEAEGETEEIAEEKPTEYNDQFIERVLLRAQESGVKIAAFEFSVPLSIAEGWVEKAAGSTEEEGLKATDTAEGEKQDTGEADIVNGEAAESAERPAEQTEKEEKTLPVKKRRKHTAEFKKQVVRRAAEVGVSRASKEFDVAVQSIYNWRVRFADETADNTRVSLSLQEAPEEGAAAGSAHEPVDSVTERVDNDNGNYSDNDNNNDNNNTEPAEDVVIEDVLFSEEASSEETPVKKMSGAPQSLEIEIAVLKAENAVLKKQAEKLRKALQELLI